MVAEVVDAWQGFWRSDLSVQADMLTCRMNVPNMRAVWLQSEAAHANDYFLSETSRALSESQRFIDMLSFVRFQNILCYDHHACGISNRPLILDPVRGNCICWKTVKVGSLKPER
jgi:hypothetical protein